MTPRANSTGMSTIYVFMSLVANKYTTLFVLWSYTSAISVHGPQVSRLGNQQSVIVVFHHNFLRLGVYLRY